MTYYSYAAAAVLFLAGLAGGMLPFVTAWDRHSAVVRRRSLYDKSAGQVETLTALLLMGYAVLLGLDLLMGGAIDRNMTGPWAMLWELLVMAAAPAALCTAVVLISPPPFKKALSVCGGLFALLGQTGACVLMWAFCLGALTGAGTTPEVAQQAFAVILDRQYWPQLGLFVLFSVLLGLTAAYALSLCWHILCRRKDDFGRDFYSFVLGVRARQSAGAGALLLPVTAVMFVLYPLDPVRAQELMPLPGGAELALSAGMLAFPLAVLLWYMISRSPVPMQRRSLAFLAMLLLLAGVYAALGRF